MLHDDFQYFSGSQGGSHSGVWHHMKFISFYNLFSQEIV